MSKQGYSGPLERIDETCWRIPPSYKIGMQVEGRIFADERLLQQIRGDQAPEQVANVAFLPGIQMASLAMPDIHWGYGFCIGGVSATDPADGGVVSPGGVGYDINCGVRLMRTNLMHEEIQPQFGKLMDALFRGIPAGVGTGGPYLFGGKELRRLLAEGLSYLATRGWATPGDLEHTEAGGSIEGANPDFVSERALKRGGDQCGTLGSGNHFLEVQVVDEIFDEKAAAVMGLKKDGICVMIHSGSRGLGYQVLRRFAGRPPQGAGQVRHRTARPAVGLRPGPQPRGPGVPGGDALRGQLRLGKPATLDVADPRGLCRSLRPHVGIAANGPDLRRGPQHRQDRGA